MSNDDDLDRAAILARRQRFIAIALSGLATACTSTEPPPPDAKPQPSRDAKPHACLKYSVEPREKPRPDPTDAMPGPCLAVPIGGEDERPKIETDTANPSVCLSMSPPRPPPPEPSPPTTGAAPCLSAVPPKDKPKPAEPK